MEFSYPSSGRDKKNLKVPENCKDTAQVLGAGTPSKENRERLRVRNVDEEEGGGLRFPSG